MTRPGDGARSGALEALRERRVLAVDGQQPPPARRCASSTSSPPATRLSLLASARSAPAAKAASVARRPGRADDRVQDDVGAARGDQLLDARVAPSTLAVELARGPSGGVGVDEGDDAARPLRARGDQPVRVVGSPRARTRAGRGFPRSRRGPACRSSRSRRGRPRISYGQSSCGPIGAPLRQRRDVGRQVAAALQRRSRMTWPVTTSTTYARPSSRPRVGVAPGSRPRGSGRSCRPRAAARTTPARAPRGPGAGRRRPRSPPPSARRPSRFSTRTNGRSRERSNVAARSCPNSRRPVGPGVKHRGLSPMFHARPMASATK